MSEIITQRLAGRAAQVEAALVDYLSRSTAPPRLIEAMRYSLEAGGKRLRPALVLECCELCGGNDTNALPAAAAIECVHTFSLIHDDLPAMDNDDLRRGKPTNHKIFGEALAILAGDGLLAFAFEVIVARVKSPEISSKLVLALAQATGCEGMIGGQVLDIEAEHSTAASSPQTIARIHELKTARLIAAACRMGALAADAAAWQADTLTEYGRLLGLAFQAVDDLLDVSGSAETMGKSVGKDAAAGKQSLTRVVDEKEGWRMAESLAARAVVCLEPFGAPARPLVDLARFVVERRH